MVSTAIAKTDSAPPAKAEFTSGQIERAQHVRQELEREMTAASTMLGELQGGFVRIGRHLKEVSENEYYRAYGFLSFGGFLESLQGRYRLERGQLYGYMGVIKQLGGTVANDDLEKMGIEKAKVVAQAARQSGRQPDAETISAATDADTTIKQLRATLEERKLLAAGEKPKGSWLELGGFFAETDDRALWKRVIACALRTDPVIPQDWPWWKQLREIWRRVCQEYLATYEATVSETH